MRSGSEMGIWVMIFVLNVEPSSSSNLDGILISRRVT